MTFTNSEFAARRPMLWHLTHRDNLPLIRESRKLRPAAILAPTSVGEIRRGRRAEPGQPILRDQDLLHAGCVDLTDGWTMDDFLNDLASRVFFWAGWDDRPIRSGRRAAERYAGTDLLIRIPFGALTGGSDPFFSRCNSGATRMQQGERVQRGPATFQTAGVCSFGPGDVVEVTFRGEVALPPETQVWYSLTGPGESL